MSKKKFKETKVGKFLVGEKGLFTNLADVVPDKGFLGVLKNLILKDDNIPLQDKETALQLLKMDEIELLEVTKRWQSDMTSDSWLSKNTRPLVLMFLTFMTCLFVILDSTGREFSIEQEWIELLKTLLTTVYVAYFGSRGFEKYKKISASTK
jgi:hypothetical protein